MTRKHYWIWLALLALIGVLLIQTMGVDAAGEPYSVSLNSPVTFPVDI